MLVRSSREILNEVRTRLRDPIHLTTAQVRSISSHVFSMIEDRRIDLVLDLSEQLLEDHSWECGVVAYDWAFRMRRQYSERTFATFEAWLEKYVRGWGDCDDFCTHAFGALLGQHGHFFDRILTWTEHPDFWVRRAAAVILIYPLRKGQLQGIDPFIVADRLMRDEHHLVLKGYGWMLKEFSRCCPDDVYQYLLAHKTQMPRVAFRYALEKLDAGRKAALMQP
ncbi:MAG TPA: DNA alkylation repair protein [Symbiobacteriaceae bacterium]|nr:DNA alkylation repair protein [Symbiobacteriaceae bacterium]